MIENIKNKSGMCVKIAETITVDGHQRNIYYISVQTAATQMV